MIAFFLYAYIQVSIHDERILASGIDQSGFELLSVSAFCFKGIILLEWNSKVSHIFVTKNITIGKDRIIHVV